MGDFLTLDDLDVAGRRVLVRADLNVPVRDGKVADQTRLVRLAPTIIELADKGARIVILSHFGRPEGRGVASLSLRVVVPSLGAALGGRQVSFGADCVGPVAAAAVAELKDGDVLVLENLRFHPGEEANDVGFAAQLAELGDMYVNDAFSCAHRAHASTEALAGLLPAAAGRLMQAELHYLAKALGSPDRPLIAVIGGAKVSTKLDLLANLVRRVDTLLIGGGMANTFLFARGIEIGASLSEPDMADIARAIDAAAAQAGCALLLPVDAVVARALEEGMPGETVAIEAVPTDAMILDIGPETAARFASALGGSRTVVWNGPLGAFEVPPFDAGTLEFARATAKLTLTRAVTSIAGGGDTVAALARADVMDSFSYVSTAGGAFLEWLEGRILPGVAALEMAAAST